jgi:quercetin dioxygenase-like cupin family protein
MSNAKFHVDEGHARQVKIDEYLTIQEYFTKSDNESVSLVSASLHGPHSNRVNRRSNKLFFVTQGILDMKVDGVSHRLQARDGFLIPPGKWHTMDGHNAQMLIICAPAFDATDEEMEE